MVHNSDALDLSKVIVYPLAKRRSLSPIDKILVAPAKPAPAVPPQLQPVLAQCATDMRAARERHASVMLLYGAHLVKNGLLDVVNTLVNGGWVTHLATNGAGTIHDWELAFMGCTEESVRDNIPSGCFGTWDDTGRNLNLAILAGALRGEGYGRSLGRFIAEDGCTLPSVAELEAQLRAEPSHPLAPARAELLRAMIDHQLPAGRNSISHPHKEHSIVANAFQHNVPLTVHPGIGYDIIATHPMFNGGAIGRAAGLDFAKICRAVEGLDRGVLLTIGSAIMAPQVIEKSLSCVNNLRLQANRPAVHGHNLYVVDIQDGGGWDWAQGEPPKTNPAYYLRFCKSFDRMGGTMRYVQCDNVVFLHNLLTLLR